VVLPAAHDALTARLVARAGFRAYQVGGFALAGARYAYPDVDLIHYYEENQAIRQVVAASQLPVLADAGDGFGDVKNVVRSVRGYEELGVSAVFIEDQASPISCGQMGKKEVVPVKEMVGKIKAAAVARKNADTFLLARTDGRSAVDVNEAIRRAGAYREAGADGVYVEGLRSAAELKRVGKALKDTPLATTLMEGGGRLPWLPAEEIHAYGFQMMLYPTTVLFQAARAVERALAGLMAGHPMAAGAGVDLDTFEEIVGLSGWAAVEERFRGRAGRRSHPWRFSETNGRHPLFTPGPTPAHDPGVPGAGDATPGPRPGPAGYRPRVGAGRDSRHNPPPSSGLTP
jgi:2-methylisocitrate lyase-like PEP mutase family enzyme